MRTSFKLILPTLILILSGCAEMVTKNYKPVKGGTVKYNIGWFMDEKNRAKAVEQMATYCSPGRAQILSEDSKVDFTGNSYSNSNVSKNNVSTTTSQGQEKNIYIHFKCATSTAKK